MEVFEYVASIYSIVLALSAASTLSALAETIKHAKTIRHYWVHTAWCVSFLFMHLALWRSIWFNTAGRDALGLFDMLPYFQWVVLWYIGSRLLAPEPGSAHRLDLEAYFFSIKNAFLICLMAPYLVATAWMLLTPAGMAEAHPAVWLTIAAQTALTALGYFSDNRSVHGWVVVGFTIMTIAQEVLQGEISG